MNTPRASVTESRFATPDESAGFLLWQLSSAWQRKLRAELHGVQLTHVQFVLLAGVLWLGRAGASVTQVDLGRATKTDIMTISQTLRALEKRGLVVRRAHPHDSRAKCVELSPACRELLAHAFRVVECADEQFFAALGSGLGKFTRAMGRLVDELE